MYTDQDGHGTYLKQNRHGTNMDTMRAVTHGRCPHTFHVDTVIRFLHVTDTRIMSRKERKLDRLKRESKGAAK